MFYFFNLKAPRLPYAIGSKKRQAHNFITTGLKKETTQV